ncbi:hypothetical protein FRC05_006850 [Tulasnella sp. 425]|nr:hypothetical protein FRC05_006850 [Tulasnella sp. 425]
MDGVKVCDTVFGEGYEFRDELSSIAILSTASRPFEFKPLKTLAFISIKHGHVSDDEALRERNPGFTAPGTRIEVRMNRVRIVEDGRENNWEDYATQVPERELTVHEADYKAGTHIMQYVIIPAISYSQSNTFI